jgi:uncharacterized protein (TIGR02145 family)
MGFITRQGWTLLLTALVGGVSVVWILGCGDGKKPSALVGHWVHESGRIDNRPTDMELFKDGTGVFNTEVSVTWKVENKRLVLLNPLKGMTYDYKVSGQRLTLFDKDGDSAMFYIPVKCGKRNNFHNPQMQFCNGDDVVDKCGGKVYKLATQFCVNDSLKDYGFVKHGGQTYKTVEIDGKTWMAENLNIKKGNSWCYDNADSNCVKYGRLYDWNSAKMVCPDGWHLPSIEEWANLVTNVAGGSVTLKSSSGWVNGGNGTDKYRFSALPGGAYDYKDNIYTTRDTIGYWWSATDSSSELAQRICMVSDKTTVFGDAKIIGNRYSVRCLKD